MKDLDYVAHKQGMQACVQLIDGNNASLVKSLEQRNRIVEELHHSVRFCQSRQG